MTVYLWDEQLAKGKAGEEVVLDWLAHQYPDLRISDVRERPEFQARDIDFVIGDMTYEVKTDFKAHTTGNLFLEFQALAKSQADLWLLYVPQRQWLFMVRRTDLERFVYGPEARRLVMRSVSYLLPGGKAGTAHGLAVPMTRLLTSVECTLHTLVGGLDEQPE